MSVMRSLFVFYALSAALLTTAACERMPEKQQLTFEQILAEQDSIKEAQKAEADAKAAATERAKTPQQRLKEDAQKARSMSLAAFSGYMQSRKNYYNQYKELSYEDEVIKIKIKDGEMKIETPEGKAKFEEDESKIKTDRYKRKTERD